MEIQDLRIFARVARVQNLSAVGNELELSPATISKRLNALEAELSVRVFDRTTRAMSLTEEGEILLRHTERILQEIEAVEASLSANVERPRGRLRVSAPTSLGRGVLGPAICTFMRAFPEIELQVDLSDRFVSFPESGYDAAIRTGALTDSALIAKRLGPDPQVVVGGEAYLAARGQPAAPAELELHDCLVLGDDLHWSFARGGDKSDVKISPRLRSDHGELLRHAALEGLGLLKISRARVAQDIRQGLLQPVLADFDCDNGAGIWIVYPSSRHVLPKLRVFIEFMMEWYREERRVGRLLDGDASSADTAELDDREA